MILSKLLKSLKRDMWDMSSGLLPEAPLLSPIGVLPANMSHMSQPCGHQPVTAGGKAARSRASRRSREGTPQRMAIAGARKPQHFPLQKKFHTGNPIPEFTGVPGITAVTERP